MYKCIINSHAGIPVGQIYIHQKFAKLFGYVSWMSVNAETNCKFMLHISVNLKDLYRVAALNSAIPWPTLCIYGKRYTYYAFLKTLYISYIYSYSLYFFNLLFCTM